ncbi:CRISPR-associated ring nuclease [Halobacterium jilantaiense]|uniref:CRISPR-associated protein (Cas_Cas02710) n=1 Tax=Halobacterium jilantaiense TaxID=355548 RepID=A0A1I0NJX3_9EURY|nr:CRISPR-associated ring nuclease [Halobacterium jilantaiense]SEW01477.1 CRISPR-associated protein (Cas_Cas02710) [Halobacterium jilantaiense]
MTRHWVTCGTPTTPGILNPLIAACDGGYVPDEVHVLSNPPVADDVEEAVTLMEETVAAYGGDTETDVHELVSETDFESIVDYYQSCIEAATTAGDEIAIDVTPGRKFMSAIAFQAGIQFGADHVYYFHRKAGRYRGRFYPEMPRTASDLIDFTEVL